MANDITPLKAEALYRVCDLQGLEFQTTAELEPLDGPLGQERAMEAIEFGIDFKQRGFNLFLLGRTGLGKQELVEQVVARHAKPAQALFDWCYVNNFDDPQRPNLLRLTAGTARKLKSDMASLVEDLLTSLPASFESEEYRTRRQDIEQDFKEQQEQVFGDLDREANEQGIIIVRTPGGYTMGPMADGKPMGAKQFASLSDEEKAGIEEKSAVLQQKLQDILRDLPLAQRELHQKLKALNEEITQHAVEQLMAWIENAYRDDSQVMEYLAAVKQNAITNVDEFLQDDNSPTSNNVASKVASFYEYAINIIVDNTDTDGAPLVFEDNPTYQNLTGRVEYLSQMGTLVTNFMLIEAGALHRANGGYLIVDADKLMRRAFAWDGLKRTLKAGEVKIQSLEQMLSLANTASLEPQSIPVEVKVILTGEPLLYYLLREYDPEFGQLFKVAADFTTITDRNPETERLYARLIAAAQKNEAMRPLDRAAVGRLIEEASRACEDTSRLSVRVDAMRDLMNEANYWAGEQARETITAADVESALDKREHRRDRYRELLQEQVARGVRLIDTEGSAVGQVNALSVLEIGGYRFGQASRITATARLGRGGVVDIERESSLGGDIHAKGVMILSSCLANRYAANQPLPLVASLAFEQSYGKVDGDSASAAEMCVLMSALGGIPLKQSLAVTGSINQLGDVQAIGGVNEKIEGFFETCATRGLTGEQGVIIPAVNGQHLMLHRDVRNAVAEGKFTIYPVTRIDDVMQLLSGLPAGEQDDNGDFPEGSYNNLIQQRIATLQSQLAKFARHASSETDEPRDD